MVFSKRMDVIMGVVFLSRKYGRIDVIVSQVQCTLLSTSLEQTTGDAVCLIAPCKKDGGIPSWAIPVTMWKWLEMGGLRSEDITDAPHGLLHIRLQQPCVNQKEALLNFKMMKSWFSSIISPVLFFKIKNQVVSTWCIGGTPLLCDVLWVLLPRRGMCAGAHGTGRHSDRWAFPN